jgi:dihydrofolate synthase / folylpolyglutamate synthase
VPRIARWAARKPQRIRSETGDFNNFISAGLFIRQNSAMSYAEAIAYLYSLRLFGTTFGLENTFRLAELAGNPQEQLRFIHVAGTNGKGSTCAMLESIYRAAGFRTGLFTSPHLISFCERLQVNQVPVSQNDLARLVSELKPLLDGFQSDHHPTFFEVITVMALKYFEEQQCEIVIWETGLGGRLDATNIVTPLASVITNVQFDHEQWLGHTLSRIAFEKAGIIKPGVPIITGANAPEARDVITRIAKDKSAPLIEVVGAHHPILDKIQLPLLGEHQRKNAAIALSVIDSLQEVLPVSASAVQKGLETVNWPGRMQLVRTAVGQQLRLDGAHNPDGARAVRQAIAEIMPSPDALILGMLREKNCEAVCQILTPLTRRILLVPIESERTAAPEFLAPFCRAANPAAEITVCTSLAEALERATDAKSVLITGSLYLIGEALELLELGAVPSIPERSLNDWTAKP